MEGLRDYLKNPFGAPPKPWVTRMSMRSIEDELSPAKFMRIHKFCIAAIDHITAVRKTSVFVGET